MGTWSSATRFGLMCAAALFITGVLCGVWKYVCIRRSDAACAPVYVDIAHRASLMYAFSTVLLSLLAQTNTWSSAVCTACIGASVAMFAVSIGSYVLHGLLRDTDNQFRPPFALAGRPVHGRFVDAVMVLKATIETGAAVLLTWGFLSAG